jgi:hypothetical protein
MGEKRPVERIINSLPNAFQKLTDSNWELAALIPCKVCHCITAPQCISFTSLTSAGISIPSINKKKLTGSLREMIAGYYYWSGTEGILGKHSRNHRTRSNFY